MIQVYPNKVWRRPTTAPPKGELADLAREVDKLALWPLLDAVEAPGFLTADHAGLLLYADLQRATKAASGQLKRLMDLHLIDAFRFSRGPQEGRGGSSPLVYCLTKTGAGLLAAHRDVKLDALNWHDQKTVLNTLHVCHRLNTVDFHVALAHYCRNAGARLDQWQYEPRYQAQADKGKPVPVSPDALAEVTPAAGSPLSLLVEIDRGTERPRRFAERTARYEAFYQSGEWKRWLVQPPTILVVVTVGGPDRVAALREATAEALEESKALMRRWRFAALEWLYQVERSSNGYVAPVATNFGNPAILSLRGSEFKPLFGGEAP